MKITRLKKLTPALHVQAIEEGSRYLVTVPDNMSQDQMANIKRILDENGVAAIIVPVTMKFYHLEPQV